jgi:hypothetical protein
MDLCLILLLIIKIGHDKKIIILSLFHLVTSVVDKPVKSTDKQQNPIGLPVENHRISTAFKF